jgi:porin
MSFRPASLAAIFFSATAIWAQDVEQQPQPWTRWDLATGDWNRNRALLEDHGFKFITTYTSQVWGNVAGGIKQGATYSGLLQFGLEIDFEKLAGWKGASFNTTWIWMSGGSPTTDLTGALVPASGIEAPLGFRALDLWLQQKFWDEVVTVRAGMFNADRDFTLSEGCQLFLNTAFGWPILYNGRLGGPPAYPFAAPGLYAAVEPGGGWRFQGAVMQGVVWPPAENPTNFYWRFNRENGLLFLGEAHYAWSQSALPGTAKLGAMFESGYPDYVDGNGGAWGGSFFYGIIDQMLWREPGTAPDAGQGLAWFNRTGFAGTPDREPLGMLFNTGFTWTGLMPGRDDDAVGIGFVWSRLTPDEASQLEGDNRGNEFTVEATYEAQLTPWFELQPDVQFIVQPGGSTALPGALVLGLSATIDF